MQLAEIFENVKTENARSHAKYGKWRGNYSDGEQAGAIRGEYSEWHAAYAASDADGDHGELVEAIHTINVLCRRVMYLTGEENA